MQPKPLLDYADGKQEQPIHENSAGYAPEENPTQYLTRTMVCDLAAALGAINIKGALLGVEIQELLGAAGAHRVHGPMLQNDEGIRAITVSLYQRLLVLDYAPLPVPGILVGHEPTVQVEKLAPPRIYNGPKPNSE